MTTKRRLEDLLAEVPLFQDLDASIRETIAGCAQNVRFQAGEKIFHEGEEAKSFFVLRHGTVSLEIFAPQRGPLVIETLQEGEVLGWSWLFPPYRWHYDARALTLVRALAFDGACLRDKCDEDPALGYALMKRFAEVMMRRLQAMRLRLLDVYGNAQGA